MYSIQMRPESLAAYGFPDGAVWARDVELA